MEMKKPASLGSSLIATKGNALPVAEKQAPEAATGNAKRIASNESRIAITVKLLEKPYLRMKTHGAANRISNQDMLEAALNEYLDMNTSRIHAAAPELLAALEWCVDAFMSDERWNGVYVYDNAIAAINKAKE